MASEYIAISVSGGKQFRDALAHVARTRNEKIGVLVRTAIDEKYGDEIAKAMSFFAPAGATQTQPTDEDAS